MTEKPTNVEKYQNDDFDIVRKTTLQVDEAEVTVIDFTNPTIQVLINKFGAFGITANGEFVIGINLDNLKKKIKPEYRQFFYELILHHEIIHLINKSLLPNLNPKRKQNLVNRIMSSSELTRFLLKKYHRQFSLSDSFENFDDLTTILDELLAQLSPYFLQHITTAEDLKKMLKDDSKLMELMGHYDSLLQKDPQILEEVRTLYFEHLFGSKH